MPQTIDVTGLSPDAVKAVEVLVETMRGKAATVALPTPPPSQLPYREWIEWFRAWVDSHPERDVVIDDERESIYDRSGE